MYNTLIENYLCNLHIDNKVFTTTKNNKVLSTLGIKNDLGFFDFRSKSIIEIDISNCSKVEPLYVTLNHNPYLCKPEGETYDEIIRVSIEVCRLYLLIPADVFSNTFNDNSFKYDLVLKVLEICPLFNKNIFNIHLTDDNARKILIEDNFSVIQRICIALVHQEAGITEEQLLNEPVNSLIKELKSFWINKLKAEQLFIINKLKSKLSELSLNPDITTLVSLNEIQKEINYYNDINIEKDINTLQYVGDVYRYFPFNDSGDTYINFCNNFKNLSYLKLSPINRWHHKLLITILLNLPYAKLTYYDIENNNSVILKQLYDLKVENIISSKNELIKLLDEEILNFEVDHLDDIIKQVIQDIEETKKLVSAVDEQFEYTTLSSVIHYWPPILGKYPESFAL